MAYVSSLFLQTALGRTPSQAAIALSPLMIGMIAASVVFRPLIERLGRRLVVIGLSVALAGAVVLWETVRTHGIPVSLWAMAPALFILGVGTGASFSSIYDVALGNIAPSEAGSASGSLSAVQQLATAIGSAVVTTVYFAQRADHGARHAMTVSIEVVGGIAALCLGLAWLLTNMAAPQELPGE